MKATVTAFVFYEEKMLLVFHKKLKKWMHVGGHVERDEFFSDALKREILEETNLKVDFINTCPGLISNDISKDIEPLPFFMQRSVGTERKLLVDYIVVARNPDSLRIQESELEGHKWVSKEDLDAIDSFPVFLDLARKAFEFYAKIRVSK